jgi:hypothetical protein
VADPPVDAHHTARARNRFGVQVNALVILEVIVDEALHELIARGRLFALVAASQRYNQ